MELLHHNTLFINNSDENNIEIKQAYISEYNLIREKLSYFIDELY